MRYFLILLFMIQFISVQGQTNSKDSVPKNEKKIENVSKSNNQDIYNILYKEAKQSNSELLETFRWAIGSIIIILLAIFGSNIFFNFRFNKKELDNLLQQIDLKIKDVRADLLSEIETETEKNKLEFDARSAKISKDFESLQKDTISKILKDNKAYQEKTENLIKNLNEKYDEFSKLITQKVDENYKEVSNKYQNQLNTFNNNYTQQISSLNDNFKSQIKTLSESYNKEISLLKNNTDEKFQSVSKELKSKESQLQNLINQSNKQLETVEKRIKRDSARIKVNLWDHKDVPANALSYRLEELELCIEFGSDLEFYLNQLLENINKLNEIWNSDSDKIKTLMDNISSDKYDEIKTKILDAVSKKPKK